MTLQEIQNQALQLPTSDLLYAVYFFAAANQNR